MTFKQSETNIKTAPTVANVGSEKLIPEQDVEQLENDLIKLYDAGKCRNPLKTIFRLYRRYYGKLLLSALFCIIKTSPLLFTPIATANIIDVMTTKPDNAALVIAANAAVAVVLLSLNIPFHMMYANRISYSTPTL